MTPRYPRPVLGEQLLGPKSFCLGSSQPPRIDGGLIKEFGQMDTGELVGDIVRYVIGKRPYQEPDTEVLMTRGSNRGPPRPIRCRIWSRVQAALLRRGASGA